jgi:hypothetical protein
MMKEGITWGEEEGARRKDEEEDEEEQECEEGNKE